MAAEHRRQVCVRIAALVGALAIVLSLGRPWSPNPFAQSSQAPNPTAPARSPSAANPAAAAPPTRNTPAPAAQVEDKKKAKEAYQQGVRAERSEDWDAAYTAYSDALNYAPDNREYFIHRELAKSRVVQERSDAAERDAISGKLEKARNELLSATYLDPTNRVLRQRLAELSAAEPGQVRTIEQADLAGPVQLDYQQGTHSFDYRGDTQGVYQEVGKQFGVEVAFDGDLVSRPVRFQVSNVDFPTAMRLLGDMTGTFWRPLAKHLFFVAQNTPQKRKDYDVSIVRTILLPASETSDQMTDMARLVREIAGIPRSDLDINSRTLTLRASPQAMAVATDLIDNLQKPAGELVLEIEVLQVNKDYARQMGITPPETAQTFAISSAQIQEATASEEGLLDVLQQVFGSTTIPGLVAFGGGLTTEFATLPGASANLSSMLSLVQSGRRILLRAEDGQPATFFVGQRIPVSLSTYSSSFVSGTGINGTSGNSVANPIVNYPAGNAPSFVATTSLRDNGVNDLIVANSADNTVSVLLGNGDGTFASQVTYPTGTDPVSIATGQFNDGSTAVNVDDFPDLAVANKAANTVSILLSATDGDGTFQPKTDLPTGRAPVSVVSANFHDLNGVSGAVDLAVANQADNTISIFQGNGDGTFKAPTLIALPAGFEPTCLAVADLNGDGHQDLVVADQGNNSFSVLLGNGNGTFQTRTDYPTGTAPVYVALGDFNEDGALDIATANNTANTVSVYYNQISNQNLPTGTFLAAGARDFPAGNGPTSIAVADYNLDGLADLVVSDQTDNAISVILNLGGGEFAANVELPVGTAPVSVATADFNGDSRPDIATANNGSADTTVILNTTSLFGSGLGTAGTPYPGVEYLDVGLKIQATPRIHPNDVTLKLALDISSLTGTSFNSIPVISNNTVEQTLRVKQNETALLAGFLESDLTNAIAGTPGLAQIPDAGLIASDQSAERQDNELLILVTPRMVRLAPHKDRVIYAGQGSQEGEAVAGTAPLGEAGGLAPPRAEQQPSTTATPPATEPSVEPTPEPPQQPPTETSPPQQPPTNPQPGEGQRPPL
ncbi:MAG TPA: FG-GAP-like repeat-containing protein [Candidatus Acidoferrales bacterium]|jgi:type II secretory pathway component GspD/PulD (secretin)|nr:FG-GAP-like repeat-containing protein [Candidatus Acidoferrales bacterium]